MRDVKYIIKRILVGVGIALVLSAIRGTFALEANALEPINVSPNGMCWFSNNVAPNGCYLTPTQFTISWTTFYGNQFGADGGVERFWWRYYQPNIGGKYYNIDLLFYNGDNSSYLDSNRGYIQNSANNIFSCRIDNTRWGVTDSTASNAPSIGTATVHCDNVYLTDDYFTFHFVDGQKTYQSVYAVTDATLTPTSEQTILENQNENTEKEIESQKACSFIDKNSISIDGSGLDSYGSVTSANSLGITKYYNISNSEITITQALPPTSFSAFCFYDENKSLISCSKNTDFSDGAIVTIPNGSVYARFTISKTLNKPQIKICKNGNQAIVDSQQELNNTINDSNVSGATSDASSFFSNFSSNTHGLSGVITSPLRLIQSLTSSTCSSLTLPMPFVNQNVVLPCMSTIYSQFPTFYSLWQLITTGLISYKIIINIFGKVREFQDPNSDRIEVLSL